MRFWRKLTLKKQRAEGRPVPRQAAPMPYGEREFRRFMDPSFDVNSEEDLRSMATALRQESFAAEIGANACCTPVAKRPTRYFGVMPQPEMDGLRMNPARTF